MHRSTSIAFSARPPKISSEIKPAVQLLAVAVRRQTRKTRRWNNPKQQRLPF